MSKRGDPPSPTEQRNPRSTTLDSLSVEQCVSVIQEEDLLVAEAARKARPALVSLIDAIVPRFCSRSAPGRVVYVGAGTSGRLGVLDASEIPPTFGLPADRIIGIISGGDHALREAVEGHEDDPSGACAALDALDVRESDTVVGITAGGTTPYVLGALRYAKQKATGSLTALLACANLERPEFVDHLILLETGPEILTGSTRMKAGTATKLILNTLSTTLMVQSGRVYENLMVDLHTSNDKLRARGIRILQTLTHHSADVCGDYLERAHGSVKSAVVMALYGIDETEARRKLDEVGGRLRPLLDFAVAHRP